MTYSGSSKIGGTSITPVALTMFSVATPNQNKSGLRFVEEKIKELTDRASKATGDLLIKQEENQKKTSSSSSSSSSSKSSTNQAIEEIRRALEKQARINEQQAKTNADLRRINEEQSRINEYLRRINEGQSRINEGQTRAIHELYKFQSHCINQSKILRLRQLFIEARRRGCESWRDNNGATEEEGKNKKLLPNKKKEKKLLMFITTIKSSRCIRFEANEQFEGVGDQKQSYKI